VDDTDKSFAVGIIATVFGVIGIIVAACLYSGEQKLRCLTINAQRNAIEAQLLCQSF